MLVRSINVFKNHEANISKKYKTANTTILREGNMVMKNKKLIAITFNNYFSDIAKTIPYC